MDIKPAKTAKCSSERVYIAGSYTMNEQKVNMQTDEWWTWYFGNLRKIVEANKWRNVNARKINVRRGLMLSRKVYKIRIAP